MERLGKLDFHREFRLEFTEVMSDIDLDRPIMALYESFPYRGHVVVIIGYIDHPGADDDKVIIYARAQWNDLSLHPGWNAIRTKPQVIEGTIVTLQESEHKLYLHVYDNDNRHVGLNYDTSVVEIEIPNAKYDDLNRTIVIKLPLDLTDFRYVVDAKHAEKAIEEYNVIITSIKDGKQISVSSTSGDIAQGNEKEEEVSLILEEPSLITSPLIILIITAILIVSVTIIVKRR